MIADCCVFKLSLDVWRKTFDDGLIRVKPPFSNSSTVVLAGITSATSKFGYQPVQMKLQTKRIKPK